MMRYLCLMLIPALMLAGCNSPTGSKDAAGEQHKVMWCSTPGKTLDQLTWVWSVNRDIDNYSVLLTDDYSFYFDPNDTGIVIP